MPRTKYTKAGNEERYQDMLDDLNIQEPNVPEEQKVLAGKVLTDKCAAVLRTFDIKIRAAWNDGKTVHNMREIDATEADQIKRTYLMDYIGSRLSDEQFEQFEKNVSSNEKLNQMIDELVKFTQGGVIVEKLNLNDLENVFCRDILGKNEAEIQQSELEINNFLRQFGFDKNFREQTAYNLKQNDLKAEEGKRTSAEFTLRSSVYDRKTQKDPAGKEKQAEYTRAAAELIYYQAPADKTKKEEDIKNPYLSNVPYPKIEDSNYDLENYNSQREVRNELIKEKIDFLAADPVFHAFVQMERSQNNRDNMNSDYMRIHWSSFMENYTMSYQTAKDDYQRKLAAYKDDPNAARNDGFLFLDNQIPEEAIDRDEYQTASKEAIREKCKQILAADQNKPLGRNDFLKAANLIVADTLLKSSSDMTFFDADNLKANKGYDINKVNEAIVNMREQVINDPLFQEVMQKYTTGDRIVADYKAAVKAEIKEKIKVQKQLDQKMKKDKAQAEAEKNKFDETNVTVEKNDLELIRDIYQKIEKYNKGKDPSDEMKRLTKALGDVTENAENQGEGYTVNAAKLDELNKATLGYYSARQGKVFSPFTEAGKARLGAVEKLAFTTDRIMKGVRSREASKAMLSENNVRPNPRGLGK